MRLYTSELVKKYKARTVVDHVSIDVNQGEIVGLLGPNGAGKTTTFYMIVGLIKPNEGRIFLEDDEGKVAELTKEPVYKRAQMGVGYLAQEASVFRRLSVEDNIRAVLEMTDFSKEYQTERVESLIEEFRLQKVRKSLGIQLSGGERRRTEIARAVAINPAFILLDEPFSALDSYLKWNLELELSDLLAGFRGPILWVSHDLGECCRNCQKVCVMENGVSSPVTDMETLVRYPATQSAAQLTGCRNFLPAHRCEGGVRLDGWDILLPLHAVGERATVAVPDGAITVEADNGAAGSGPTLAAALADMAECAEGTLFLDTAEHIVLLQSAGALLPAAAQQPQFRPAAKLYLARLPELHAAEAVEFLQAHPGTLTLALARAALVRGDQIRPAQLLPAEDGGMKLAG